jgi:hypothetical protein
MSILLAKDWTEIALGPDGSSVLVNGKRHVAGRMACRALAAWEGVAPGARVVLRPVLHDSPRYMAMLDRFLSRFDDLQLKRDLHRGHGMAVNFTVRAATAEEIAAAEPGDEPEAAPARSPSPSPLPPRARLFRRPAPLGPDEVRALAARYARGEITRDAMSRAFWR